jgi:Spy/CpxP family protein refolding chaperone
MRSTATWFFLLLVWAPVQAAAQVPAPTSEPALYVDGVRVNPNQLPVDNSPFGRFLFAPELVMGNQEALALTDAQRAAIRDEVRRTQTEFIDRQWKISEEGEKLARLLQAPTVDEKNVLLQVDRILDYEREIKRLQVGLLVRIRNTLTAEQRTRLSELRRTGH